MEVVQAREQAQRKPLWGLMSRCPMRVFAKNTSGLIRRAPCSAPGNALTPSGRRMFCAIRSDTSKKFGWQAPLRDNSDLIVPQCNSTLPNEDTRGCKP